MNTPAEVSTSFLEAAHTHVDQHEQHALEVVQRLRLYSENYVEPAPDTPARKNDRTSDAREEEPATQLQDLSMADVPEDARATVARRDSGMQTGLEDMPRLSNH